MDRDEAIWLVSGDEDGVAEWNRRRREGEKIPNLSRANLSLYHLGTGLLRGAGFASDADFSGADLRDAKLEGAKLEAAKLSSKQREDLGLPPRTVP